MKTKTIIPLMLAILLFANSCKSHYEVTSIQRTRIVVDARYDAICENSSNTSAPVSVPKAILFSKGAISSTSP